MQTYKQNENVFYCHKMRQNCEKRVSQKPGGVHRKSFLFCTAVFAEAASLTQNISWLLHSSKV